MKKSIIKTAVLAALMALPMFAKAQTFAGITAEQNAQNTPEGWTAVELPQLPTIRSEEHTSELQSRFGISYAVFCLKKE